MIEATHGGEKTLIPAYKSYSAAFEKDYRNFCMAIDEGEDYMRLCNWDKYVDIHYRTEIPGRLLTGPWTEDDIRLLFWLVRGGASIQFGEESTTAEVSFFDTFYHDLMLIQVQAARGGFYRAAMLGQTRVLFLFGM